MQSMLHKYNLVDTQFETYAKRRIVPILKENCDLPELVRNQERTWTNNNCESANFILKIKTTLGPPWIRPWTDLA